MITIKLCDHMAQFFPPELKVMVRTAKEAISALCANFTGFGDYLRVAANSGVSYQFYFNGEPIELWQLSSVLPEEGTLSIRPVVSGSGQTFKIITGVALLGLGIAGVGFLAFTPTTFMITGAALLLSAFRGQKKSTEAVRSRMFGGNESTTTEGGRIPIAFGVIMTGGIIISAGIRSTFTPLGGGGGGKK